MRNDMHQAFDQGAAVQPRARVADPVSAEYLKAVNAEMSQRASIRYMDVFKSLHGDLHMLRDAIDRGVGAVEFVERTIADFGLMRNGGEIGPELVHGFNRAQAAICEFAMGSEDWRLGTDGWVYRESDNGLGSLRPLKVRDGSGFGFGVFFHEGASLGEDGRAVNRGDGDPISGRSDIADAVAEFENRVVLAAAPAMR